MKHGCTHIPKNILMSPDFSLEEKYAFCQNLRGGIKTTNRTLDRMRAKAIGAIFIDLHHWLLDNSKLSEKEKALTAILLCRAPHNPISSERALARITQESPRTIGRILNSLVEKGAFTTDRPSQRETHYFFCLKFFVKDFNENHQCYKMSGFVKVGKKGFYIKSTLLKYLLESTPLLIASFLA